MSVNIREYGDGVSDSKLLGDLVQFVREYERTNHSTTVHSGQCQHSPDGGDHDGLRRR